MNNIKQTTNNIIFENNHAVITISKTSALVENIIDKKTGADIKGDATKFFSLWSKTNEISINKLTAIENVITVHSENGTFDICVCVFENYFTFEMVSPLPIGTYCAYIAHAKYSYDFTDKNNTGACNIAMSIWMDPVTYPDFKERETKGRVIAHLGSKGAKLGLVIAPIAEQKEILKEAYLTVDKKVGICSKTGGVWGRESRENFSNYTIQYDSSRDFIEKNIPFFKEIGVDQIDLHKGAGTYRQGDFKLMKYENTAEFKKNVCDLLESEGMSAGLHTYSFYIDHECDTILSNPEFQKDLKVMEYLTLKEDIDANSKLLKITENTDIIPDDRGFCVNNSPLILIDNELIRFEIAENGLILTQRGCAGTTSTTHKKGAKIKHIEGHYHGLCPVLGSKLFLEIARYTANLYNECGFKMIYLDALDGILYHSDRDDEAWFYMAQFVCELLKHCKTDPILEAAYFFPSLYASRGRIGAWDTPYRAYKSWNQKHSDSNKLFIDRYSAPILGWYDFYPETDFYPGNEHTKYHHTDSIDHLGALAIMYDYPNVFNGTSPKDLERCFGAKRNIALYKKYDSLRKKQYFSKEYRQKLIDCPFEVQLIEKSDNTYSFIEKDYQFSKLYDLDDDDRNYGLFTNPFCEQIPFIRIEAMLSTNYNNPFTILSLDETRELTTQKLSKTYGEEIDISDKLAKTVKVFGNGKDGAIRINMRCATNSEIGHGEYIIETNFKGWREFILLESDNGERPDLNFPEQDRYGVYRSSLNNNRITGVDIDTVGDMSGVKMSSIVAYEHTYDVLKNPTVEVNNEEIMFECELMSSDFIEFDGKTAKVIDRYGNEKPIWFSSAIKAPSGNFNAKLTAKSLNRCNKRAKLTFGFTGKEIK